MISAFWEMLCGCSETKRAIERRASRFSYSGSSATALPTFQYSLVGRVVGEHVEDEALFDGLAHRVEVEGHVYALGVLAGRTARASGPSASR